MPRALMARRRVRAENKDVCLLFCPAPVLANTRQNRTEQNRTEQNRTEQNTPFCLAQDGNSDFQIATNDWKKSIAILRMIAAGKLIKNVLCFPQDG
jgi:hypothetical protein